MSPRFHIPRPIRDDEVEIALDREESRHLARALRLGEGDEVVLFDSTGAEFRVRIERASAHAAEGRIVERLGRKAAALRELTLAISLIRNEPMRWLIQKATEIGVERVAPFVSQRTVLSGGEESESDSARRRRWERVSLAACKQSGRSRAIETLEARRFERVIADAAASSLALLAWEGGDAQPIGEVLDRRLSGEPAAERIVLVIGPEGGFAPPEYALAVEHGFVPVGLGPHILRAETAAVVGAAMVLGWPARSGRLADDAPREERP